MNIQLVVVVFMFCRMTFSTDATGE